MDSLSPILAMSEPRDLNEEGAESSAEEDRNRDSSYQPSTDGEISDGEAGH